MEPNFTFRRADRTDEDVLRDMLYLAVFLPPGTTPPDRSIVARREVARYVEGWGRPGDDGIIASLSDGDPIGAAWLRLWSENDRGYGFIDTQTPELSVAVRAEFRGRGIGTQLLRRLLQSADQSHESVSLSVTMGNPAVRIYERLGFETVAVNWSSKTMRRARGTPDRS